MIAYFDRLSSKLTSKGIIKVMGTAEEKDETGQYPAEEQTVVAVWCQVVPQTGSLLTGRPGETVLARTTHKVAIRYRWDIKITRSSSATGLTSRRTCGWRWMARSTTSCTCWTPI